jgi:hypothetical protein
MAWLPGSDGPTGFEHSQCSGRPQPPLPHREPPVAHEPCQRHPVSGPDAWTCQRLGHLSGGRLIRGGMPTSTVTTGDRVETLVPDGVPLVPLLHGIAHRGSSQSVAEPVAEWIVARRAHQRVRREPEQHAPRVNRGGLADWPCSRARTPSSSRPRRRGPFFLFPGRDTTVLQRASCASCTARDLRAPRPGVSRNYPGPTTDTQLRPGRRGRLPQPRAAGLGGTTSGARETILVLSGCRCNPSGARIVAIRSRACSARCRVWHNTTRSGSSTSAPGPKTSSMAFAVGQPARHPLDRQRRGD